ncbi:hypothetical protein [Halobaculum rarum]|uniref:hypothetical protein n=1 Tax=Halobaculum rarum TaxID=3075122 RepID=UPI0032AF6D4F
MTIQTCTECWELVPQATVCIHCGAPLEDGFPQQMPTADKIRDLADKKAIESSHESVTNEALRFKHGLYQRPLVFFLYDHETPEFLSECTSLTVETSTGEPWDIDGIEHLLVTDDRMLALGVRNDEDFAVHVSLADVVAVESSVGWLNKRLIFSMADGSIYTFILPELDEDETEIAATHLHGVAQQHDSTESEAYKFMDAVDEAVAASDDAQEAAEALAQQFRKNAEPTVYDQVAADAGSFEEFLVGVSEANQTRQASDPEAETSLQPATSRSRLQQLRDEVALTIAGADRRDVSEYALGSGLAFGGVAVAASLSTPIGVAALLAGGAATGAYASTHPDSIVSQINLLEMAQTTRSRTGSVGPNDAVHEVGTETMAGVTEYLQQADVAHAEWLANVDPEFIMRSARQAGTVASQSGRDIDETHARVVGGGIGLLAGGLDREQQETLQEIAQLMNEDTEEK